MKLVTFAHDSTPRVGIVDGEWVYEASLPGDMATIITRGVTPERTATRYPLASVRLLPPVRPSKIVAIGRNYAEHAKELGNETPEEPLIFAKFPSALIGQGETIRWRTSTTGAVDYEGELAVVIGKPARDVAEKDALGYVFGYTIANDVSARDLQFEKDKQWTRAKSLDTFCPLGPWIVQRADLPNVQALRLETLLNGETVQDGNTKDMIFNVAALIAYCSRNFTLLPGDLLLTGTPAGVGRSRTPPRYLGQGDVVTVRIEGIGELTNPCTPEN